MSIEVKEITKENIHLLMDKAKAKPCKTLAGMYGKLKRGIDGIEYQKAIRNG